MTKLAEVLNWLNSSQTNQIIAVGAAVILLALAIWMIVRRRKKAPAKLVKTTSVAQSAHTGLQEVFDAYRLSHPSFYNIIAAVQESRHLDEFMSSTEFAGAIAKLRIWQAARRASRSDKEAKQGILRIDATTRADQSNHEVRAAMITILRILYSSPDVSKSLASRAESEMDRLLESLTG
jgi:LPXTG-motif cell wall-anchored protein